MVNYPAHAVIYSNRVPHFIRHKSKDFFVKMFRVEHGESAYS